MYASHLTISHLRCIQQWERASLVKLRTYPLFDFEVLCFEWLGLVGWMSRSGWWIAFVSMAGGMDA